MESFSQEGKASNTSEDAEQNKAGAEQSEAATESATFDFTEKSWSSDFVLNVEGTKLYVAKAILSLASPVFFRMFQSDFKESGACEMELPGKSKRNVIEFLGCIYPNKLSEISRDTALRILPLVEEYQVLQLKQRCESVLLDTINTASSAEELCQFFGQACLYNLKQLREKCMQLTLEWQEEEQLEDARRKYPLPIEATNELLEKRNAIMKAEIGKLQLSYETLKDYIAAEELKKFYELRMSERLNWKEAFAVLTVSIGQIERGITETVKIWDKSLSVNIVSEKTVYGPYKLYLKIEVQDKNPICCSIAVRCFLVSRHRSRENMSISCNKGFDGKKQNIKIEFAGMSEISTINQGFLRDGKLGLIVQIFMSEPV